ncbi:MAG TPA: hypothetical protein VKB76_02520 [Ktedonobacterales bacterium]|nr:hypothetical protein [Ktedonobacterales bacterium]
MQTSFAGAGQSWSRIGNRHFIAVSVLAVAIGIIATIEGTAGVGGSHDTDQLAFFFPAAQRILDGDPFKIYAIRAFGSYPNYNPPLSTVLIAPLLAIGQSFLPGASQCVVSGYNSASCRSLLGFVGIAFIPFVILMGVAALAALRRLYPAMSQGQALAAYALVVLSPLTWLNFTIWWHFEQPMMLFFFVAGVLLLQARRPYLAGVFLGLAILSRTTAAVPLIALLVVLVAERAWPTLARVAGMIVVVAAIGFGPFFLFDYHDTAFSLLSWRGTAQIGNSIWSLFLSTPLDSIARRLDLPAAIVVAAIVAWLAVRRFGVSAFDRNLYGVLALAALLVPMLSKTNWPYYYAEPFVFIVIWEFATLQDAPAGLWRWPVLAIGYLSAAATLGQFMGLPSATQGGIVLRLMGLIQFGSMLAFAVVIWQRLTDLVTAQRSVPSSEPVGGGGSLTHMSR